MEKTEEKELEFVEFRSWMLTRAFWINRRDTHSPIGDIVWYEDRQMWTPDIRQRDIRPSELREIADFIDELNSK